MRTALFAALAALIATEASAQSIYGPSAPAPRLPGISMSTGSAGVETGKIRRNIRDGRKSGQLTRAEARDLRKEANQIGTLSDRYAGDADGLSASEFRELDFRARALDDYVDAQRLGGAAAPR